MLIKINITRRIYHVFFYDLRLVPSVVGGDEEVDITILIAFTTSAHDKDNIIKMSLIMIRLI